MIVFLHQVAAADVITGGMLSREVLALVQAAAT
jgi:hypothetical protein